MGWAAAIGAIGGAATQLGGQLLQNDQNRQLTHEQMDWEKMMSDTAMTRRVADLKNAGLNPNLAWSSGGASTPGFAPIPMGNIGAGAVQGAYAGASTANQIQQASLVKDQIAAANDKIKADTAVSAAQAIKIAADTDVSRQMPSLIQQQTKTSAASAQNLMTQSEVNQKQAALLVMQAVKANVDIGLDRAETDKVRSLIKLYESENMNVMSSTVGNLIDNRMKDQLVDIIVGSGVLNEKLLATQLPAAENARDMALTGWGRFIEPYLPSAFQGSNAAANMARVLSAGKRR